MPDPQLFREEGKRGFSVRGDSNYNCATLTLVSFAQTRMLNILKTFAVVMMGI